MAVVSASILSMLSQALHTKKRVKSILSLRLSLSLSLGDLFSAASKSCCIDVLTVVVGARAHDRDIKAATARKACMAEKSEAVDGILHS